MGTMALPPLPTNKNHNDISSAEAPKKIKLPGVEHLLRKDTRSDMPINTSTVNPNEILTQENQINHKPTESVTPDANTSASKSYFGDKNQNQYYRNSRPPSLQTTPNSKQPMYLNTTTYTNVNVNGNTHMINGSQYDQSFKPIGNGYSYTQSSNMLAKPDPINTSVPPWSHSHSSYTNPHVPQPYCPVDPCANNTQYSTITHPFVPPQCSYHISNEAHHQMNDRYHINSRSAVSYNTVTYPDQFTGGTHAAKPTAYQKATQTGSIDAIHQQRPVYGPSAVNQHSINYEPQRNINSSTQVSPLKENSMGYSYANTSHLPSRVYPIEQHERIGIPNNGFGRAYFNNQIIPKQTSAWSPKDDRLLRHLKEEKNLGWRDVATYFPTRTPNACQFRWRRIVCASKTSDIKKSDSKLRKKEIKRSHNTTK